MIKNPLYLEKELLKFLITHIPQDNWHKKRNSLRQQKGGVQSFKHVPHFLNKRIDHVGIVTGVCQELGWPTSWRRWSPTNGVWSVLARIYLRSQ